MIERFGDGYSDLEVTQRTVENISTELHDTLSKFGVKDFYILMATQWQESKAWTSESLPGEVSAIVTIGGTVPEVFAVGTKSRLGEQLLSITGWAGCGG